MKLDDLLDDISARLERIESELTLKDEESDDAVWMPPQQQKLELLKKAVGVENQFDKEESSCGCDYADDVEDELDILRKNAGLDAKANAVLHLSSDAMDLDI